MRALLALCTLALFATSAVAEGPFPKWHQLEKFGKDMKQRYTFAQYVMDANRAYAPSSAEFARREKIFNKKLEAVIAHNKAGHSWKKGINQFSDWTEAEFKNYNRARPEFHGKALDQAKAVFGPKNVHTLKATPEPDNLPRNVDYTQRVNPPIISGVKNQGSCGSCWAHSSTESMESYFALKFGQLPVLSTQQVTSCTHSMAGCGGGSYVAGWMELSQHGYGTKPSEAGLAEEWTYPYVNFFAPQMAQKVTQKCQNITERFPIINAGTPDAFRFTWWPKANVSGFTMVEQNDAIATLTALALHGPQSISVASSTWGDYEEGILHNNYTNKASNLTWQEIDHDVQLVGYGWDNDLQQNFLKVKNSWGTNYGEQGFIRLALNDPYHEPCGNLTGTVICGTSGVLSNVGFPHVTQLAKQNGYYF